MIAWNEMKITDVKNFSVDLRKTVEATLSESLNIDSTDIKKIAQNYLNNSVIDKISKLIFYNNSTDTNSEQTVIDKIQIEYPYFDNDYLSTYYIFYSKKSRKFPKECCRLHLWKDNLYYGYISLRPTLGDTKIGRSLLSPNLFFNTSIDKSKLYLMVSNFKCHNKYGQKIFVESFPWMRQETDIAVCVHVAIWSALKYFGNKYSSYPAINMGTIIDNIPELQYRKTPTFSLHLEQTPYIFRQLGFSPLILKRNNTAEELFKRALLAYVESGIPVVAFTKKDSHHAVTIMGHGNILLDDNNFDNCSRNGNSELFIYSSELINSVVINDDMFRPYHVCKASRSGFYGAMSEHNKSSWVIDDFAYLIIPLYERMQYSYEMVEQVVDAYIRSESFIDWENSQYIVRIYITSANSLKEEMAASKDINSVIKTAILEVVLPKFVWCVDISTREEYKNEKMSAKMIIDTTSNNFSDTFPFLYIHNKDFVQYYDYCNDEWKKLKFDSAIAAYSLYTNNLKMYPCDNNGKNNYSVEPSNKDVLSIQFDKSDLSNVSVLDSPANDEYYSILQYNINQLYNNQSFISIL